MTALSFEAAVPSLVLDALEAGVAVRDGAVAAAIGETLQLDTGGLESYFFADWNPILVDLLVVAAAADYCDVVRRRPTFTWGRCFDVRVAVHDLARWENEEVRAALEDALSFLTGDIWRFSFVARRRPLPQAAQGSLKLQPGVDIVMPYSDGLDSRAVRALMAASEGASRLVRVRLGSGGVDQPKRQRKREPFAVVPYKVKGAKRVETSARSRGFKFAVVTGIAAVLAGVGRIIVTESGQGAFGPMLAVSGQTYPDFRVHPAFSRKMERLFVGLTGQTLRYEYPRLWSTKGETLRTAAALRDPPSWTDTRSCWQGSRHSSVDHMRRQCGVCAACMLRRMSMFAAGIDEAPETYVWERLSAARLEEGVAAGFVRMTPAIREYAIAGVLHMDHLADMAASPLHARSLARAARLTAAALGRDEVGVQADLRSLLQRHAAEWRAFREALGPDAFVSKLASARP